MTARLLLITHILALFGGCDSPAPQPSDSAAANSTAGSVPPPPPGSLQSVEQGEASAALNNAEAQFLSAYRDAHALHDADALARLYCWDGVSSQWREIVMENIRDQAQYSISDLKLMPTQAGEHEIEVSDGKKYVPNLTPTHTLHVKYAPAPGPPGQLMLTDATFAIGMKSGRYLAVVAVPQ